MGLATVVAALILLTDHLVAYSVFIGRLIYGDWADRVINRTFLLWAYRSMLLLMLLLFLLLTAVTLRQDLS
jgi:hypothetical protein